MPDNPHPHPPEFDQTLQEFLIRFYNIVSQDVTSLSATNTSVSQHKFSTTFFTRTPRG